MRRTSHDAFMHSFDLIVTLTGGLAGALIFGYLTQRVGLSPIVGYLLAGVAVGPNTPGFVADTHLAEQLAEVGVILLMFGVGLQFHVEELLAVRRVAIPGAVVQSAIATVLGALLVRAFGWRWSAGIVFGIALSVASTVVLVRVLADHKALHTPSGHLAVGWLVVEDLLTVLALVVLPIVLGPARTAGGVGVALLLTAGKVAALVGFAAIAGTRIIPRILDHIARTHSRELFSLTILVLALGIAVGSALVFNVSMALGAFLAGLVVGRSDYAQRAASEALPLRDAFAVLFFVSVGMLLQPAALFHRPWLVAGTLGVVLIGKPLAAFLIAWLLRCRLVTSLSVAVALAQIGEFSFMLSRVGKDLGLLTADATNVLISAAIVSIVLNPILFGGVPSVDRWMLAHPRLRRLFDRSRLPDVTEAIQPGADASARAIVVGYGPTGQTVSRLLRENGCVPTVVDLNVNVIRVLREQGVHAVYGDATHREILAEAGTASADHLILTSAEMGHTREAIRNARELNPEIHVFARTAYLRELPAIRALGVDVAVSAEGEVGLAMAEMIMRQMGATPDQIDRERDRVRSEQLSVG
jgi:K+:H+ antiporter